MSVLLPRRHTGTSNAEVFSAQNLMLMDETVAEVFSVMLGIAIFPTAAADAPEPLSHHQDQTAIIGFAGVVSGICEISLSLPASIAIASAMLDGAAVQEDSESICDAVGELCNMLAGGWKNRLPEIAAHCSLSVPIVIAGSSYEVHRAANLLENRRSYLFGPQHVLQLTLLYDPG